MLLHHIYKFQFLFLIVISFLSLNSLAATRLPNDEVEVLKEIANTLGKTNWNFSADPCGVAYGWTNLTPVKNFEDAVTCNCSFLNNTVCHLTSIVLKAQNLQGNLPIELAKLPYLQEIDLTRNYLNGTIPPQWGAMQLVNVSLFGNRLTGSIPKEFGNISTLQSLNVEFNQLSGSLPDELGNLTAIKRLLLTSNNFTGKVPDTFSQLTSLNDFRIGDNQFSGRIPDFIQNWLNLGRLVIQGSGLDGPIPAGISLLENMTDLRISDLKGNDSTFPSLINMNKLIILIMRSCNIVGELPDYLGNMTQLLTLDLSFNKLFGGIPSTFTGLLSHVVDMYLTGNSLTGKVPDWITAKGVSIDLSYNNFSVQGPCQNQSVNLFRSSSTGNTSGIASCLKSFQCPNTFYKFNINCGGQEVTVDGNKYEDDLDAGGPSQFYQSKTNWAFSSTGNFMDDDRSLRTYTWSTTTNQSGSISELYSQARLSPLSLTYYGFCLGNGNYTVGLHFLEIMFTDDKTYYSLGKRIFDVYIQGNLVLKDFNIKDEAGGPGGVRIKSFNASVSSNTLEIRFQWSGKGTTAIPVKGVYGPLISALSVTSNFKPPSESGKSSTSVGVVVGIIAAVVSAIIFVLLILWWKGCFKHMDRTELDLKSLDLKTGSFTLKQIKAATNNFDVANKIGEGGFGPVYKGHLLDGTIIAVKQLSSKSKQGNREFLNEIGMITALHHPHLVKLHGCCIEGNQLLLVYEYMENNSLAHALFGGEASVLKLDWPTRRKICIGIARGLAFLHEESVLKVVHRDIKATNVLLDKDLQAKISDFGLAKLDEEENTHISTRIAGTYGYMAPEYAMRGYLTDKADVYSFGIVALEIVSGRSNTSYRMKDDCFFLLDWAHVLKERGSLLELVDPNLRSGYNKKEVMGVINIALLCTNTSASHRPSMSTVVSMLEGKSVVGEEVVSSDSSYSVDGTKEKAMKLYLETSRNNSINGINQSRGISSNAPWSPDSYPMKLDTDYWENRHF